VVNKTNNLTTDAAQSEGIPNNLSALERRRFLFNTAGKGAVVGVALANPMRSLAQATNTPVLVCEPIPRIASPTSSQLIMCSVSGMQSAIGSRQLNTVMAKGYSPGFWGQTQQGDVCLLSGGKYGPDMKQAFPSLGALNWTSLVSSVFPSNTTGLPVNLTLALLMVQKNKCTVPAENVSAKRANPKSDKNAADVDAPVEVAFDDYSNSEWRHWMCAILNSGLFYQSSQFPYHWTTIRDVANGTNSSIDRGNLLTLLKSLEHYNVT
jgi:hypothetical protein